MDDSAPFLLLGGRSLVAPYLLKRLAALSRRGTILSRKPLRAPSGFDALQIDLNRPGQWTAPAGCQILSLLPLWVLADRLKLFADAKGLIAISSTSRFGKAGSDDPAERATAQKLAAAEELILSWSERAEVPVTILRPTLIYDGIHDQNVARIAKTIRRFGTFPIANPGKGLRQPIHADDVAAAIVGALDNPRVIGKQLNIAGGQILTYRAMVEVVFKRLGRYPAPLLLPTWLLRLGFAVLTKTGFLKERHFGIAVFNRMNENLIFDCREGLDLLGYAPRDFSPIFENFHGAKRKT